MTKREARRQARRRAQRRRIALTLTLVLVVAFCAVGGTIAWLTSQTDPIVNTFTTSDINITLTETTGDEYMMAPGFSIAKDPVVKVVQGSEPAWLFVKIDKSENFDSYMNFEVADGWTQGDGEDIPANVYYRKVPNSEAMDVTYAVLKDNKVYVNGDVTKEMMKTAKTEKPTLTFTAYASQLMTTNNAEFAVEKAWENLNAPAQAPLA